MPALGRWPLPIWLRGPFIQLRAEDGFAALGDWRHLDQAGMIGSRQTERVLAVAEQAGAKVVLVGGPEQLQAIEAGAASGR